MLLFPSPLWFRGKHTSGATGPSSGSRVWGEAGYESVLEQAPAQAALFPPDSLASCPYPGQSRGISSFGGWYIQGMEIQGNFHSHRRKLSDFCTLSSPFLGELSRLSNCFTLFPTHSNLLCSDRPLTTNSTHISGCWAHHSQASDFTAWALILSSTGCPYPRPSIGKSYKYDNLTSQRLFFFPLAYRYWVKIVIFFPWNPCLIFYSMALQMVPSIAF